MVEVLKSYLRDKTKSSLVLYYAVFWMSYHWQAVCALLFVDESVIYKKFGMLKNEYIYKYFFDFNGLPNNWLHIAWIILGYIIPFVLAILAIWVLPLITNKAYRKELEDRINRRVFKAEAEARLEDAKRRGIEEQAKTVEAEGDLAKKQASLSRDNPEIQWKKEFERLSLDIDVGAFFERVKKCVYEHGGLIRTVNGSRYMNADDLQVLDIYGLAVSNRQAISLTDKGKFFMRLAIANAGRVMPNAEET